MGRVGELFTTREKSIAHFLAGDSKDVEARCSGTETGVGVLVGVAADKFSSFGVAFSLVSDSKIASMI